MRPRIGIVTLGLAGLLAAVPASGQGLPAPMRPPSDAGAPPIGTITVVGRATVRIPADSARFTLSIYGRGASAAEARAQQAAIADARERAALVARAAGVGLGKVVAVYESLPQTPGCPTKPDRLAPGVSQPYGIPSQPSIDNFEVVLSVNSTVSFAIR